MPIREIIDSIYQRNYDQFRRLVATMNTDLFVQPIPNNLEGWYLTHLVASLGDREMLRVFLETFEERLGNNFLPLLNAKARAHYGYQATHLAVMAGNFEILTQLCDAGANIHGVTDGHETLLFLAVRNRSINRVTHGQMLQYLLNLGLEPITRTVYHQTPFDVVMLNNDVESFDILFNHPVVRQVFGVSQHARLSVCYRDLSQRQNYSPPFVLDWAAILTWRLNLLENRHPLDQRMDIVPKQLPPGKIRYLSFEGGGVKGIAFCGALRQLQIMNRLRMDHGNGQVHEYVFNLRDVRAVAGTSAGSIASLLIAIGHNVQELEQILDNMNFRDLINDNQELRDEFFRIKQQVANQEGCRELLGENLYGVIDYIRNMNMSDMNRWRAGFANIATLFSSLMGGGFAAFLGTLDQTLPDLMRIFNIVRNVRLVIRDVRNLEARFRPFLEKLNAEKGLFSGEILRRTFAGWLKQKGLSQDLTFLQLHQLARANSDLYKDLYVSACCLDQQRTVVFSYETTPDMSIIDAVRSSISIPTIFYPHPGYIVRQGIRMEEGNINYVDGGMHMMYPLRHFDQRKYKYDTRSIDDNRRSNHASIGFRLLDSAWCQYYQDPLNVPNPPVPTFMSGGDDLLSFLLNLGSSSLMFAQQENDFMMSPDLIRRTVFINTDGVNGLDFDLSVETKQTLIERGSEGVNTFINRHQPNLNDAAAVTPAMRPR